MPFPGEGGEKVRTPVGHEGVLSVAGTAPSAGSSETGQLPRAQLLSEFK